MITWLLFAGLLLSMLAAAEIGRRLGIARLARVSPAHDSSALLGCCSPLFRRRLAIEDRRHLITAETNAIGMAYL
jgi:hypothetical protein